MDIHEFSLVMIRSVLFPKNFSPAAGCYLKEARKLGAGHFLDFLPQNPGFPLELTETLAPCCQRVREC